MFSTILLTIFSVIWLIFILMWSVYQIKQFWKFSQKDNVGLVSTNLDNIKNILDEIIHKESQQSNLSTSYFIELGSGRGIISEYVSKNYLFKKVIAIENDWFIHTWVRLFYLIKTKLLKQKLLSPISHINQNIFDYNYEVLESKKIFYCYLFPQLLDKLYKQGVFKDSVVISLSFEIPDISFNEVLEIKGGILQKKLFFYEL